MRKPVLILLLLMLVFSGLGSSALVTRSFAGSKPQTRLQQEKRLGPKPTPRWYWRWAEWRLGEGHAKGRALQHSLRPRQAPNRIPRWAWRRLHFFLLARRLAVERIGALQTRPGSGGGETYDQAIAYTQTRPTFTPTRTILVSNASELRSAITNLQAGDLVQATTTFTVNGETVIKNRLPAPAELDLTGITFTYTGGNNLPAIWLNNAQNLYIYGGNLSTADTGGTCLLDYGSQHVLWWGFYLHDCGGSGFAAFTVNGPVSHNDFQGEITKVGQNLTWDPHTEKGTGLHGAILWDANSNYSFTNNRFALYTHDIPTGACVELGNNQTAPATGNTLYEKCVNATNISTNQTGGNGLQLWGYTNNLTLTIKYLQVDNAEGYALWGGGVYAGQTLSGVTVEYGRADNTNQSTGPSSQLPWDGRHGIVYESVRPAR